MCCSWLRRRVPYFHQVVAASVLPTSTEHVLCSVTANIATTDTVMAQCSSESHVRHIVAPHGRQSVTVARSKTGGRSATSQEAATAGTTSYLRTQIDDTTQNNLLQCALL